MNVTVELIRPLPVKRSAIVVACIKGEESAENADLAAVLSQLDRELEKLRQVNDIPARFYQTRCRPEVLLDGAGAQWAGPCPYCTVHRTSEYPERGCPRSIDKMVALDTNDDDDW